MDNPVLRRPRPKGSGNIGRVRLDTGRIRYRAVAPVESGQRVGVLGEGD